MGDRARLWGYLRLHLARGVGPVLFHRLVEAFGSAEAAAQATPTQWRQVKGVGQKVAEDLAAVADEQIDAELAEADRHDVRILVRDDADYPEALRHIFDPPPVLYVRGRLEAADAVAVGVVGARRCTHYGAEQAERFGGLLGRAGLTVVSGGARGIDTAAHQGVLAAGGRTIAVMGCGLSTPYPPENAALFDRIVDDDRGAVVGELPMTFEALSGNFHGRNRIISGLSLGVVVVEAARRSGALITARQAAEQGKVVFAVPGRADSPLSAGTNQLIRDGAILVADLDDVLDNLGEVGAAMAPEEDAPPTPAAPADLAGPEAALLAALADGPLGLDELARRADLGSGQAAASMTMLVLKGLVTQQAGNVFARKR